MFSLHFLENPVMNSNRVVALKAKSSQDMVRFERIKPWYRTYESDVYDIVLPGAQGGTKGRAIEPRFGVFQRARRPAAEAFLIASTQRRASDFVSLGKIDV